MVEASDIGRKAEVEVVNQLKNTGWRIEDWDPEAHGAKDIMAEAGGKKLMVHVQSAISPNNPPDMTGPEIENMKRRAENFRATAFQARVQIDRNLNRVGDIRWKKIY
jgi:Holliday junction resolvase